MKPLGGPERRGEDGRGKMLQEGSQRLAANRPARDNGRKLPQTLNRTERGQERRLAFGESQNNQRLKENLTASLLHVTDNSIFVVQLMCSAEHSHLTRVYLRTSLHPTNVIVTV